MRQKELIRSWCCIRRGKGRSCVISKIFLFFYKKLIDFLLGLTYNIIIKGRNRDLKPVSMGRSRDLKPASIGLSRDLKSASIGLSRDLKSASITKVII